MRLSILLILLVQISSLFAQDYIFPTDQDVKSEAVINTDSIKDKDLYHASFDIMKNHFTAIIIIKNNKDNDTANIYMMSEIGMKLMSFYLYNDEIIFVDAADFLNDKKTIKLFDRFFTSLLTTEYDNRKKVRNDLKTITYIQGRGMGKVKYYLSVPIFSKPYENIKVEMFPKVSINLDLLEKDV